MPELTSEIISGNIIRTTERRKEAAKLLADEIAPNVGGIANRVAYLQGETQAHLYMQAWVQRELTNQVIQRRMLEILFRGADDTWSGRGNDTQRSHHDGLRNQFEEYHSKYLA